MGSQAIAAQRRAAAEQRLMARPIFVLGDGSISDFAYRLMLLQYRIQDSLFPLKEKLTRFGIQSGATVIDYGCGPGRHLEEAVRLVGPAGKVYVVDIQPLALAAVQKRIDQHGWGNVQTALARDYSTDLPDHVADLIYALDMFHAVGEPARLLVEWHRLLKGDGALILETGHQPSERAQAKVLDSGLWRIIDDSEGYFRCRPADSGSLIPTPAR